MGLVWVNHPPGATGPGGRDLPAVLQQRLQQMGNRPGSSTPVFRPTPFSNPPCFWRKKGPGQPMCFGLPPNQRLSARPWGRPQQSPGAAHRQRPADDRTQASTPLLTALFHSRLYLAVKPCCSCPLLASGRKSRRTRPRPQCGPHTVRQHAANTNACRKPVIVQPMYAIDHTQDRLLEIGRQASTDLRTDLAPSQLAHPTDVFSRRVHLWSNTPTDR